MTELVHLTVADGVATIMLDSPAKRNALSRQLVTELFEHLKTARSDESARVLVLAATGTTFCAGADLTEAATAPMQEGLRGLLALFRTLVEYPKPVIAKVEGHVRAGGLGILGACDFVVAADTLTFAFTEARLGLAAAAISLPLLPRLDARTAARWFLTGSTFSAAEAVAGGLLSQAVAPDQVGTAVEELIASLLPASPQGLAATKTLLTRAVLREIDEHGEEMVELSARLFASDEAREGMTAFLEKRPPRWTPG